MGLSVFFDNSVGIIGELLVRLVGGFFGLTGYAVPLLIILHGLIKIFKPQLLNENKRFSYILLLLMLFSAMLQAGLHDISYYQNMNLVRYIKFFYQEGIAALEHGQEFLSSGGVLGGIIGVPLLFVFKKWGTMIILTTLSIIMAMLITRLSIAEAARKAAQGTSHAINGVVDAARRKKENFQLQREAVSRAQEAAASKSTRPAKKKARILDFCLGQDHVEDPTGPQLMEELPNEAGEVQEEHQAVPSDPELSEPGFTLTTPQADQQTQEDISVPEDGQPIDELQVPEILQSKHESKPLKDPSQNEEIPLPSSFEYRGEKSADYIYPPIELLSKSSEGERNMNRIRNAAVENAKKLETTLESFGIGAKVINVSVGPAFTRYELQPAPGIKVSRIVNLTDDIALNLASTGVRIEAPIPGKAAIGVEVPNKEVAPISLRSVLESKEFKTHSSKLSVALGKDISGENVVIDLAKMPHVLIAGATGSGKSVCINSIIVSLLYKASPEEVKLLMVDPKVVELGVYNGIPHLLIPVVTDPNKAAGALRWAVSEMTTRYKLFADRGVRDLMGYNSSIEEEGEGLKLPEIVIIIDELADLMMVAPHDVEDSICRLAQMARAAGMHLVIATQRPSVNVITGVIKANIPSRIAFAVSSQVDSRTILDMAGAEKLLGKGDMLYYPVGIPKPIRVKGAFLTDKEVELAVDFVKNQIRAHYDQEIIENINDNVKNDDEGTSEYDELLSQAIEAVIDCGQASVSFIQRKFKVGYARAGRIIDQMAERNIISGYEGSKPRHVLISRERWEEMKLSSSGDEV
ncbi:MAG TPA: cell division protein FtsK [Ruminiclostridium sp.]|nr:cell division protein FtsK [Ruminiclostridium sp.]